jgi:hypothetical protein
MLKKITFILLIFLTSYLITTAKCSGPTLNSTYGGHCPNGMLIQSNGLTMNSDTVLNYIGSSDTVHLFLYASNFCPQFDSIQWYKNGILIYQEPASSIMNYSYAGIGPGTYTCKFKLSYRFSYTIYFPTATSVSSSEESNIDINVFPNPCNGIFSIYTGALNKDYTITISDISGKVCKTSNERESLISIDIRDLSPGFYMLVITDASGRKRSKKLVYN